VLTRRLNTEEVKLVEPVELLEHLPLPHLFLQGLDEPLPITSLVCEQIDQRTRKFEVKVVASEILKVHLGIIPFNPAHRAEKFMAEHFPFCPRGVRVVYGGESFEGLALSHHADVDPLRREWHVTLTIIQMEDL
jgi:hypothetical protein